MVRVLAALVLVLAGAPAASAGHHEQIPPPQHTPDVAVSPVAFEVENPLTPGETWTVRGDLFAGEHTCTSHVLLLLHGLSYGRWAWDFPLEPDTYSTARALARAGYAAVAIDQLGYDASAGDSDPTGRRANGYTLTIQSYAHIAAQIADQLRAGSSGTPAFEQVGLVGHSAGTEIAEYTAGLYGNVDLVVATGYHHFPSQRIVVDFLTGDVVRAALGDYEYFGDTPEQRNEYMYHLPVADPAVVAADRDLANLTPSGQVWTIASQPSRVLLPLIDVPVLLVLAENDLLFPPASDHVEGFDNTSAELSLFASSPDASAYVIPEAGHSFMLHPNAPQTNAAITSWLDERLPACD